MFFPERGERGFCPFIFAEIPRGRGGWPPLPHGSGEAPQNPSLPPRFAVDSAKRAAKRRASRIYRGNACFPVAGETTMAKPTTIKIRLNSTAGTGHFYVTKKNARTMTEKMVVKKYDPVKREHVEYKEGKIK